MIIIDIITRTMYTKYICLKIPNNNNNNIFDEYRLMHNVN